MTFAIVGGGQLDTGYTIDNSLRFNDGDSPYLSRTPASAGDRKTWTWSGWVKRSSFGVSQYLFSAGTNASNNARIDLRADARLQVFSSTSGLAQLSIVFDPIKFRDLSAWYHFVIVVDTSDSTSTDRVQLYVNGTRHTQVSGTAGENSFPAQNYDTEINTTNSHSIGRRDYDNARFFDGYMAEVHFIDGQALDPTDFGEFDEDSGIWKPKEYEGTYGTNGFYLDFEDSAALGDDVSGNGNNFTPTNLASSDQMLDSPTNNFCTLNFLTPVVTHTLSEANLKSTNSSGTHGGANSTINYPTSGKWYHEVRINAEDSSKGQGVAIGSNVYRTVTQWGNYNFLIGYMSDGTKAIDTGYSSYGTAQNVGDIIGVAYNADDQELTFYHNNSSQGTIPTSEMDGTLDFDNLCPVVFGRDMGQTFNFGQDSSFAGAETRQNNTDDNGEGDFYYTPPSGYLTLNTSNLATELSPTIDDGSEYFNTVLYTGNGSTQSITGVGFQPDWTWIKERSSTSDHEVFDSTRGATNFLSPNTTGAEGTNASALTSFDSDGFSVGSGGAVNENSQTYVGWNWLANGGTTSSNTDGSITSTVQANTTAGFSIVTWTGDGTEADIGHGLGVNPDMIILKDRDASVNWLVYHSSNGENKYLKLNETSASSGTVGQNLFSGNNSLTFGVGSGYSSNTSGNKIVAYCFAEIEGYSKFGSYTGNGSSDGPFVYTGFRPAFVMIKRTDTTADWHIDDATRNTFNPTDARLDPNSSGAESSSIIMHDFTSNGFKTRTTSADWNGSGGTFIYIAFAENPFVSSAGVPVPAR